MDGKFSNYYKTGRHKDGKQEGNVVSVFVKHWLERLYTMLTM